MEYTKRTVLKMPHGVMNVNVIKNDAIYVYAEDTIFLWDFHAIVMRLLCDCHAIFMRFSCDCHAIVTRFTGKCTESILQHLIYK